MLDVIIYEDEEVSINQNIKVINNLLIDDDIEYQIHVFRKYNDEFIGLINNSNRKLFIINLETDNNRGIEVATIIRKISFDNIIILTANCGKHYKNVFSSRLMAFDYIYKNRDYDNKLCSAISDAIKIIRRNDMFVFEYKHIVYRIPFKSINYIEKEANIKRCIIHTVDNVYYIVSSINKLISVLNNNFIKTHQACIINAYNVKILDCINNKIIFKDGSYVSLVTESSKRKIKELLFNNQC